MKYLVLIITFSCSLARAANPNVRTYFEPEQCQKLLANVPSDDVESLDVAKELIAWMSLKHPIFVKAIDRTSDMKEHYTLLYMANGFALPPPKPGFLSTSEPERYWSKNILLFDRFLRAHRSGRGLLDPAVNERALALDRDDLDVSREPYLGEFSRILHGTFFALGTLTLVMEDIIHDRPRNNTSPIFNVPIRTGWKHRAGVAIPSLTRSFQNEEFQALRNLYEKLEDEDVRAHVVHLAAKQMGGIVLRQQTLCRALEKCDTSFAFMKAYREVINPPGLPVAQGTTYLPSLPAPQKKFLTLAITRPMMPSEARPQDLPNFEFRFFDAVTNKHLQARALRTFLFMDEIWSSLRDAPEYLTRALFDLEKWRIDDPEWEQWSRTLAPSRESVQILNDNFVLRKKELTHVLGQFDQAELAFRSLSDWFNRIRPMVVEHRKNEELNSFDRWCLDTVEPKLPQLEALVASARETIGRRRMDLAQQIDALTEGLTSVAAIVEADFSERSNTEAFEKLKSDLERFAKGRVNSAH